jgi:leishmanolysin
VKKTIRGKNTTLLKSPNVLATAREYYNCSSIEGMQLENEGGEGSAGSHWEKTILFNEYMNPQAINGDTAISK